MNVREAINFGLNKLNFENIRENQRKVVESYLSGRDVLMISPKGSGKSLTFHIAPFAIDFFKHGERDDIQTVCLVIFPLVSMQARQVVSSRLHRSKRRLVVCPTLSLKKTTWGKSTWYDLLSAMANCGKIVTFLCLGISIIYHLSNYTKTIIRLKLVNIGEYSPRLRLWEYTPL